MGDEDERTRQHAERGRRSRERAQDDTRAPGRTTGVEASDPGDESPPRPASQRSEPTFGAGPVRHEPLYSQGTLQAGGRARRGREGGSRDMPASVRARHVFADLPDDASRAEVQSAIDRELARPGHADRESLRVEARRRFPAVEREIWTGGDLDAVAAAAERDARVHTQTPAERDAAEAGDVELDRVEGRQVDGFAADGDRVVARRGRSEVHTAHELDETAPAVGIGARRHGPRRRDGESTRTSTQTATATVGSSGPEVQLGRERTTDRGGGVTETTSSSAGFSAASGEATVGVSRRRGRAGDQESVGGEVGVDTSLHGIEGASGSVSWGRGRRSVSVRAGFQIDIEEPVRQPDGTFRITGTLDGSAGLGVDGRQGDRARGSASIGYQGRRGFTRVFATEREARIFYEDTQRYFDLHGLSEFDLSGIDSADEARGMAVGESATRRDGIQVRGGATVTQSAFEVGATLTLGGSHEARVTRSSATAVRLRITDTTRAGISATGGVPTTGVRLGAEGTSTSGVEVEFDISTPQGEAALQRALGGDVPIGASGPGWRLIATRRGSTSADSHGADVLVAGFTSTSTTGVEDEQAADGSRTRQYTGTAAISAQTILPDELTEGTALGAAEEQVGIEMTSRGETTLSAEIQGSDAADTHRALSEVTGATGAPHLATGAAAGTWQVSAQLTDAQLRRFMDQAADGQINLLDVGLAHEGDLRALVTTLRSARNLPEGRRMDVARRAVAEFFAETGADGSRALRAALGERPHFDVALEGSDVFTGEAGNAHLRSQITDLRRRLAAPGTDLVALTQEARALLREQERRLHRMRDRSQFRELPQQLRVEQVAALEPIVRELRRVTEQIGTDLPRMTAAEARATAETAAAGEATQSSRLEHGVGPESRIEDAERVPASAADRAARTAMEREAQIMRQAQMQCRRTLDVVTRERDLHNGRGVTVFRAPAIEGLYMETDAYERANQAWTEAQRLIARAHQAQASYDQLSAYISGQSRLDSPESQQASSEVIVHMRDAARYYGEATTRLRESYRVFTSIRNRHRAERQFWGERPPPLPE